MYVPGMARTTFGPGAPPGSTPSRASATWARALWLVSVTPARRARVSTTIRPTLWRLPASLGPRVAEPDDEPGVAHDLFLRNACAHAASRSRATTRRGRGVSALGGLRGATLGTSGGTRLGGGLVRGQVVGRDPRGGDDDDLVLRVVLDGGVLRARDVAHAHDRAVLEALHVDADGLRDAGGRDRDGQRHDLDLVDRAGRGLADDVDRDVDGDLLAGADDDEVDVLDGAADRVTLDVLGQGHLLLALDVEGDDRVRVVLEDEERVVGRHGEVLRRLTVAVEDRGDLVRAAGATGGTLAELGTDLGGEGGRVGRLGHGD